MTTKLPYGKFSGTFEIGQGVEVIYRGRVGRTDRKVFRTITRITRTQIALNDGERFMIDSGNRIAARSRSESADQILSVYA